MSQLPRLINGSRHRIQVITWDGGGRKERGAAAMVALQEITETSR